jgi:hypothetical protein
MRLLYSRYLGKTEYLVQYQDKMSDSIINLLPHSQFSSIRKLIESKQSEYPKEWFYKPVGIEVEITNKCNLKCSGCGQRDETIRPDDVLKAEEYISILKQTTSTPIFACSITGGETLLFLEMVKKILREVHGSVDIYKLNSNSYRFVNDQITTDVLKQLKENGFGEGNKYIKAVLVTSIGQQNENGMPLKNSVFLTKHFYDIFDDQKAICTVNATDKNIQRARYWLKEFRALYKEMTGHEVDKRIPFRAFMLNNVPTLERLGLMIQHEVPIKDLIFSFKSQYLSWKCLNIQPEDPDIPATTLTPRCLLRPNGDLYACPGYNYTHKIGNLQKNTLMEILERTNKNEVLRTVFTQGLPGLLEYVKKYETEIEKEKLSLSYAPCDVCQYLSRKVQQHIQTT